MYLTDLQDDWDVSLRVKRRASCQQEGVKRTIVKSSKARRVRRGSTRDTWGVHKFLRAKRVVWDFFKKLLVSVQRN